MDFGKFEPVFFFWAWDWTVKKERTKEKIATCSELKACVLPLQGKNKGLKNEQTYFTEIKKAFQTIFS